MKVRVVDRWDLLRKDVYVYYTEADGSYVHHQDADGYQLVRYAPGQSFEGTPTFSIPDAWLGPLLEQLSGSRSQDKLLEEELERRLSKEEERVDKMLNKLLEE